MEIKREWANKRLKKKKEQYAKRTRMNDVLLISPPVIEYSRLPAILMDSLVYSRVLHGVLKCWSYGTSDTFLLRGPRFNDLDNFFRVSPWSILGLPRVPIDLLGVLLFAWTKGITPSYRKMEKMTTHRGRLTLVRQTFTKTKQILVKKEKWPLWTSGSILPRNYNTLTLVAAWKLTSHRVWEFIDRLHAL